MLRRNIWGDDLVPHLPPWWLQKGSDRSSWVIRTCGTNAWKVAVQLRSRLAKPIKSSGSQALGARRNPWGKTVRHHGPQDSWNVVSGRVHDRRHGHDEQLVLRSRGCPSSILSFRHVLKHYSLRNRAPRHDPVQRDLHLHLIQFNYWHLLEEINGAWRSSHSTSSCPQVAVKVRILQDVISVSIYSR